MNNIVYLSSLYDYYKELLTEKQRMYFEDYYFDNLTLSEIASNNSVSRNAVHKQIKEVEDKINFYEEKLKLYKKSEIISNLITDLEEDKKNKILEII